VVGDRVGASIVNVAALKPPPLTEASLVKASDGSTTVVLVDTGELFWSNDDGAGIVASSKDPC